MPRKFAKVYIELFRLCPTRYSALLYVALLTFTNKQGLCWPRRKLLAEMTGITDIANVRRGLRELQNAGLILMVNRSGKTFFQVSSDLSIGLTRLPVQVSSDLSIGLTRPPVRSHQTPPSQQTNEQTIEQTNELSANKFAGESGPGPYNNTEGSSGLTDRVNGACSVPQGELSLPDIWPETAGVEPAMKIENIRREPEKTIKPKDMVPRDKGQAAVRRCALHLSNRTRQAMIANGKDGAIWKGLIQRYTEGIVIDMIDTVTSPDGRKKVSYGAFAGTNLTASSVKFYAERHYKPKTAEADEELITEALATLHGDNDDPRKFRTLCDVSGLRPEHLRGRIEDDFFDRVFPESVGARPV